MSLNRQAGPPSRWKGVLNKEMVILFWGSIGLVLYTLLGFPAILFLLTQFRKKTKENHHYQNIDWPKVTLVIAAYNEENSIKEKLDNSLALDYPEDKLEIIVVSDSSSDQTDDIVKSYAQYGVRLHRMSKRGGKLAGHKSVLKEIKSEIVVFSDATTIYQRDAIKELVKHFFRKDVGCVGGAVTYKEFGNHDSGIKEQKYLSYEVLIRKMENQVDSVPVVSGAIYALRPELYPDIPNHLADDLINPLYVKKLGYRTLFELNAKCWELSARNIKEEFKKRRRIAAQNVAGLFYMKSLLNPFKYGLFSWILLSHKVLRLVLPFIYILIILSGLVLFPYYFDFEKEASIAILVLIICTYFIGRFLGVLKNVNRLFSLPMYFIVFHFGIIMGVFESIIGKRYATWKSE